MKKSLNIKKLKAIFIVVNLFISIIAISNLISAPIGANYGGVFKNLGGVNTVIPGAPSTTGIPTTGSAGAASAAQGIEAMSESGQPFFMGGAGATGGSAAGQVAAGSMYDDPFFWAWLEEQEAASAAGAAAKAPLSTQVMQATGGYFAKNVVLSNLAILAMGTAVGALVGNYAGGRNGTFWGAVSGGVGTFVGQIVAQMSGEYLLGVGAGLGVAVIIFILTYEEETTEIVQLSCKPFEPPVGGDDCELCNQMKECSEYTCKSLGQACDIVNAGTAYQKCIWKNPRDTFSPLIKLSVDTGGYKAIPDQAIRPPKTGVEVITERGMSVENGDCIKAFTPLEFTITTDEPSMCRIDYNLTSNLKTAFDDMAYCIGGECIFSYNHTEKLSLPGPDAVAKIAPEIKNDGTYTLYVRCRDANGNFNQDAFSVRFCVEKGPDTTPPFIVSTSIPSKNPVQFNISSAHIEVYVNEPSTCKWAREDKPYDSMENEMDCDTNLWEMNSNEVYTCRTDLTGIQSRKENDYFFRCRDVEGNTMNQGYPYILMGTQPLNILKVGPNETIYGATDTVPVFLNVLTDNGYDDGNATCYYSKDVIPVRDEDYIEFLHTGNGNNHTQRQDLGEGNYIYYFKCVDLGGNADYNHTRFTVKVDRGSPIAVRAYKEANEIRIVTDEKADCSYSNIDCNFDIESGIKMTTENYKLHGAEWKTNQVYFIRCKDYFLNQPNPNKCTIILKASELEVEEESTD